jgi:hypothetical protein
MATVCISIKAPVYERLKKLKRAGESFSDVLQRELPEGCETAGEVEDYFAKNGVPKANRRLLQAMLSGRGRRSKRGQR